MRPAYLLAAVSLAFAPAAQAITVDFTSNLSGAAERPEPVDTTGFGFATGQLSGDPGTFVFTYSVEYFELTGPAFMAHIHDAVNPGGLDFSEQFGPIVHDLDSIESPVNGDWRYDDAGQPLTDALADALLAGRLYFNFHTEIFPGGEIRGQILPVSVEPPPPPPPPDGDPDPQPIPLPAPVWAGLIGLAGSTFAAWRTRRRMGQA